MTDEHEPSERTVTVRPVGSGAEDRELVKALRDVDGIESVDRTHDPLLRNLAYGSEVIRIAIDFTADVSTGVLATILYNYVQRRADSLVDEDGWNPVSIVIGGREVTSETDEQRIKETIDELYDAKE